MLQQLATAAILNPEDAGSCNRRACDQDWPFFVRFKPRICRMFRTQCKYSEFRLLLYGQHGSKLYCLCDLHEFQLYFGRIRTAIMSSEFVWLVHWLQHYWNHASKAITKKPEILIHKIPRTTDSVMFSFYFPRTTEVYCRKKKELPKCIYTLLMIKSHSVFLT